MTTKMALSVLCKPLVFLLCIALSSHSTTLATDVLPSVTESWAPSQAVISGVPAAGSSTIPMQAPSGEGAPPAEVRLLPPIHRPAKRLLNPSVHPVPLINPPTPSVNALYPHGSEAAASREGEAQPATFGSHAGPALPLLTELPVGVIKPAPGARGVNADAPYINFTSLDALPDLPHLEPSPLATVEPETAQNGSRPKPAVCSSNPQLNLYSSGTILSSICRANLYLNTARTYYNRCTAWFADPTHAVIAGHCIADSGSATFKIVGVNGRYGTVCCKTQSTTGPDNCPSGYGFDIISAAAAQGWFYTGRNSNDGAVLKLRRPTYTANFVGIGLSYQQPSPFCTSGSVNYGGFPGQSTIDEGCNQAWAERFAYATTSGAVQCTTTNLGVPSLGFPGSVCPGMSGGPLWSTSTNYVWGILTQGNRGCVTGRSNTYFTAISSGNTTWGVNVASLIRVLP